MKLMKKIKNLFRNIKWIFCIWNIMKNETHYFLKLQSQILLRKNWNKMANEILQETKKSNGTERKMKHNQLWNLLKSKNR